MKRIEIICKMYEIGTTHWKHNTIIYSFQFGIFAMLQYLLNISYVCYECCQYRYLFLLFGLLALAFGFAENFHNSATVRFKAGGIAKGVHVHLSMFSMLELVLHCIKSWMMKILFPALQSDYGEKEMMILLNWVIDFSYILIFVL